jgi:cyclic pyranopterin phosphate synthase
MRISITDRCHFECSYCKGKDIKPLSHQDILTYEEILNIVKECVDLGIHKFKVTGGEPLIRKNALFFIKSLKAIPGVEEVTITTNGSLLDNSMIDELYQIGINGINFSIDTLNPQHYQEITHSNQLSFVLSNLLYAYQKGIKVKINTVLLDELSHQEILDFINFIKDKKIALRFIELMPMNSKQRGNQNKETLLQFLNEQGYHIKPVDIVLGNGPAVYYQIEGIQGYIGFIEPIHGKFCSSCNRVRLTSTGYLKACLFYLQGCDLRKIIRENQGNLKESIRDTIYHKPKSHDFENESVGISMNKIGG